MISKIHIHWALRLCAFLVLLFCDSKGKGQTVTGEKHPDWPHVRVNAAGESAPEPGYIWAKVKNGHPVDGSVRWTPGLPYIDVLGAKDWPLEAAATEGDWHPSPGYTWAHLKDGVPADLSVKWTPKIDYYHLGVLKWPHIHSSRKEGDWQTDEEFEWAHPKSADDLSVRPESRQHRLWRLTRGELEGQWTNYLHDIQIAGPAQYANWSSPPYDLYVSHASD